MDNTLENEGLKNKVKELKEQVEYLRISRRVLMNLIEKIEKEKRLLLTRLELENKKLHKNNLKYAHQLLNKNRRIIELENNMSTKDGGL